MCVHDDAFGLAVGDAENDVGRLATDAVELDQFVERVRDISTMFLNKTLTAIAYRAGLIAEKAGAANHGLEFRRRCGSKVRGTAVTLKQGGCDEIDAFIGALRAQDGSDEKLKRVMVVQGTTRAGIGGTQSTEDDAAARQ